MTVGVAVGVFAVTAALSAVSLAFLVAALVADRRARHR